MVDQIRPLRPSIADSYNRYYDSGLYDARYPRPNPSTFRAALELAAPATRILDFGAGTGRYTLPFLRATDAFVCAYDISADACQALADRAAAAGVGDRRLLVTADFGTARAAGPYGLVTMLFGVLSHIQGAGNRVRILESIRSVLTSDGVLLLTVPHALRRFPLHRSPGGDGYPGPAAAAPGRYFPAARPVVYRHLVGGQQRPFPYYLFSRRTLTAELTAAGFALESLEPDSILPERRLVRRPALAPADGLLCRVLPGWAGYGLRAVCRVSPAGRRLAPGRGPRRRPGPDPTWAGAGCRCRCHSRCRCCRANYWVSGWTVPGAARTGSGPGWTG
jgi:SAM-dependent methyltransferase